jgi:hypothetical protein
MSPLFAWMGAVLGLLFATSSGLLPGVLAYPAVGTDLAAPGQPRVPAAGAPDCPAGWGDPDRSYPRSILTAVVDTDSSAWAVGLTSVSEDPRYPLAARWDGESWVEMPVASSSAERALFGLDRSPSGRMWATGYRAKSSLYYPLMMRWNGSEWTVSSLGTIDDRGGALLSVRARSDTSTWAVGYKVGSSGQRPLAIRRAGTKWQESSPSIPSSANGALMDIDVRASNDAWAVGWVVDRGAPRPYLTHWDGRRWRTGSPVSSGSEGALTSVAIAGPDDVWAVGYAVSSGLYRPIVQHWNGSRWRLVEFPSAHSQVSLLRGVQIDATGDPVVVGTRWDAEAGHWRGLAAHRVGSRWDLMDSPGLRGGTELRGLALREGGSALVVGASGSTSYASELCPEPQAATGIASVGATPAGTGDADPEPTPSSTPKATPSPDPTSTPRPTPRPTRRPSPRASVVARDMTKQAGLARDTASYGAVRTDFNNDGWPDLFIGQHANLGRLVFNDGDGTFSDAPGVTIPRRDRHGCSAGDANGDKRPDLYCANGALRGAGFKSNELYIQQADGTFRDEAMAMRATDPFGRGRLAVFFDLDHDRYADLFLADRPARPDGLPSRHRILANPTGERYVARSVAGIDTGSGADCLRPADLDRDGWEDIVLCERAMDRPSSYGLRILRNDKGTLVDVTRTSGIEKRQAVDAIVADMDGDRRPDIVEVTPYQLRVHLRRGDRYTLGYTRNLRNGVAVGAGDVDGDGDRDLYIAQGSRTKQRADVMLRNRGTGRSFDAMSVPGVRSGSAESVTAIDYDRNGLMDFLVLNGKGALNPGPVQLIAFFPR